MKIEKIFNKKEKKHQFKARFQFNKKEFFLTADTRKELDELVEEIRVQERRDKRKLPTVKHYPTVEKLFEMYLAELIKAGNRKKRNRFERASAQLVELLPAGIKINELKKGHFKPFIDARLAQKNELSGTTILSETVNKDLSSISAAIKKAEYYFPALEGEQIVQVPKLKIEKERRRERLIEKTAELDVILEFLRRAHQNPKTAAARRRLADELEIKYETGMRRAEVAALEKKQYRREEKALHNILRIKTGTITKFFPLSERAVEIIESRIDSDSPYIFSSLGRPNEADYKTLKNACAKLGIPYGQFTKGGFVPHDLRHNFATDIVRLTDIETAKNLTGHTGEHILTYLHTDETRMRTAMRRREGREVRADLTELYNLVKDDKITLSAFIGKAENLIRNG